MPTMDQLVNVLLAMDETHTALQKAVQIGIGDRI